jgi:hypothetical protein
MRRSFLNLCASSVLLILFLGIVTAPLGALTQSLCQTGHVCVTTWQQDTGTDIGSGYSYRTGQNLSESVITASSITTDTFGKLCSANLDGQVYAQPLVVTDVNWRGLGTNYDIVYVVTENDTVYAIDSSNCNVLNTGGTSLLVGNFTGQPTMSAVDCSKVGGTLCSPINPIIGILGTPVISISSDKTAGTLYVVAQMQSVSGGAYTYYHFLHALDITTLNEGVTNENYGAPIQICSDANLCGSSLSASSFSQAHIQRPGLLYVPSSLNGLSHDMLYVAFSMMDGTTPPDFPNGVMVGYNASSLSDTTGRLYFQTSAGNGSFTSSGGGIWMSGAAPAFGPDANSSSTGNYWIYLTTANGTWDGSSNWGDSMLKLSPTTLTVPSSNGYFTPADQYFRSAWGSSGAKCTNGGDVDFGPAGVTLLPNGELANWPQLAISGDKLGGLWFYDRTSPGGHNSACDPPHSICTCLYSGGYTDGNVQTYWTGSGQTTEDVVRGGLAYWDSDPVSSPGQSYIYAAPYQSPGTNYLTRYPLCALTTATTPIDTAHCTPAVLASTVSFPTGATPTVSAASSTATEAIVWAISSPGAVQKPLPTTPGVLYAFDAVTVTTILYSSNTCSARDRIAPGTKFSVPTVANGKVFVGAEQCAWDGSKCLNAGTGGTFYIFGLHATGSC